jgi:putative beta-glucosidase
MVKIVGDGLHEAVLISCLNRTYACENRRFLIEILREEWGFDGVVISDWGAYADLPGWIWRCQTAVDTTEKNW